MKLKIVGWWGVLSLMACGPNGIKDVRVQVEQKNSEAKAKTAPFEVYLRNGKSEGVPLKANAEGTYELGEDFVITDKAPLWFVVKYNDVSIKPKTLRAEWTVLGEAQQASLIPLQNKAFEEAGKKELRVDLLDVEKFDRETLSLNTPIQVSFWNADEKSAELKAEFKLRAPFPLVEKKLRREFAFEIWKDTYPAEIFGGTLYQQGLRATDFEIANPTRRPMKLFVQYLDRPVFKAVTRVKQLAIGYEYVAPRADLYSSGYIEGRQVFAEIKNQNGEVGKQIFELSSNGLIELKLPPNSKATLGLVMFAAEGQGYIGFRGDDLVHLCAYMPASRMDGCRADYFPSGVRIEGKTRARALLAEEFLEYSDIEKGLTRGLVKEVFHETAHWSTQLGKEVDLEHFQSPQPFFSFGHFFLAKPGLNRPNDL